VGSARRLGAVGVLTIAFSTLVALSPPARANKLVTVTIPAPKGEISSKWLSYSGPPRANVLLPDHYNPGKRYPLVVVLNGLNCNYDWYVHTGVISVFKGLEAIVVMPEGGNGWYADWWNDGERGGPSWETYELETVLPTILDRYRILPQRRYHAIVGHSMGGLGAVYLGGRLPGFFGSVATTSGFVDPQLVAQITQPGMGLTAYAPFEGDYALDPVEGPPQGFYADGHNPTRLAINLEQTRVFVSTGTGVPSSAGLASLTKGGEGSIAEGSALEGLIIYPMNQLYDKALRSAGIDFTYQVHSGGHDIPDNINEFKALFAWGLFRPVPTHPSSWVNDTVATSGQLWDIRYRFAKPPNQVVQFRRSGSSLTVSAAGSPVTLSTNEGCVIQAQTPAAVQVRNCREAR
jgi:S-formylglutathione hydrolase FrmB